MTDEILVDEVGIDGMTAKERELASNIYAAMQKSMHDSDRSQQAQEWRVGVSDLGFCSERLRRFLVRETPEEIDKTDAFIGTWLGEGVERAVGNAFPEAIIQSEVVLTLKGETNVYEVTGHPDILFPHGLVLDVKSAHGLALARRTGMTDQGKKFQRHGYGYAAFQNGMFGEGVGLEDVVVGNVWVDRSGDEPHPLVRTEPLSMEVIEEATQWLDEVVYSWQHSEEARKEPPREVCRVICGFFEPCRGMEPGGEGLLTDPTILAAVDLDLEGKDMEKRAKLMRKEAKSALLGVAGSTGEYEVYWSSVGPTKVPEHERAGYDTLKIRPIKK